MAFSFGGTAPTQPSLFGTTTTTPAPSTGFGFGSTPAAGTTTGFGTAGTGGFGTTPATGGFGFGTPATSASTGFGGFGTPAISTATGTGFGTGTSTGFPGFGLATTTTASTGFGFGAGTTSTGFGTGTSTGFGTGTSTGFGTGTSTGFGTGTGFGGATGTTGFGTATGTTGFGFGTGTTTGLGAGTSAFGGTGTSAFGAGTSAFGAGTSGFGGTGLIGQQQQQQQQQQLQQQQVANDLSNMAMAVSLPQIYGDERDAIIAKWNQLQAFWGTGKGLYNQNGVVEFKADNPFCRFKAIGYNAIKGVEKNKDGLIIITLKKKHSDVCKVQQQIVDVIHKILGSKPTLSICVEGSKPLPDDKTELIFYVIERPASGPARRVPASELFTFLSQPAQKNSLINELTVDSILPKMELSVDQLKDYLDTPPSGIDPLLWQQAKLDNPNPVEYVPVPMIGFKEVQQRLKYQEQQTSLHQQRIDEMGVDLSELQNKHSNMLAKLEEYKRKHLELGHRLLQVIVKQEVYRRMGYAIQAEEEHTKVQLEAIQAELNHPTQFKGRLNELMSQIRMQNHLFTNRPDVNYHMDIELQHEMKQLLKQQQQGLEHLIQIIKDDSQDLNLIEQGLLGKTV